jgi:hypothetical protein
VGVTDRDSPMSGGPRPSPCRTNKLRAQALLRQLCSRRPRVTILDSATGQAKMGELVGVLGPSGVRQLLLKPHGRGLCAFAISPLHVRGTSLLLHGADRVHT